jgi:succinylarginine dihydrolase
LEPEFTTEVFRTIFPDDKQFQVHDPLPDDPDVSDEGAANHSRLCNSHGKHGIELFVFGRNGTDTLPQKYPARQTRAAGEQISRHHCLDAERTIFVQQNPAAIDAGVFHNDVISVANENVMICHEQAYVDQRDIIEQLREKLPELCLIEVSTQALSLQEAVQTYLFNSQLVTLPDASMLLLCPLECADHPQVRPILAKLLAEDNPVEEVKFIDVRQSMQNGGGPACLRLRVVLTETELSAVHQPVLLTDDLYHRLRHWIQKHYRDELTLESLGSPNLLREVRDALNELSQILELGMIYPFQQ